MIDGYCTLQFGQEFDDAFEQAIAAPGIPVRITEVSDAAAQDFITCVEMGKLPYLEVTDGTTTYTFLPIAVGTQHSPIVRSCIYLFSSFSVYAVPALVGLDGATNAFTITVLPTN